MNSKDKERIKKEPNPKKDFYGIIGALVFLILVTLFLLAFPVFSQNNLLKGTLAIAYALVFWQLFGVYIKKKDKM